MDKKIPITPIPADKTGERRLEMRIQELAEAGDFYTANDNCTALELLTGSTGVLIVGKSVRLPRGVKVKVLGEFSKQSAQVHIQGSLFVMNPNNLMRRATNVAAQELN